MTSNFLPGYDETELKILRLFHPYAFEKIVNTFVSAARFSHYTSADTAMRIIQGEEVWMRKSTAMNDFMEIEHGFECLNFAYKEKKSRLEAIFESVFPGFCAKIEERFNAWLPAFRNGTFIACISEHDASEDKIGRLSMWRAYGGSAGVAMILKGAPLINPTDALRAYSSPVSYLNKIQFSEEFGRVLDGFVENLEFVHNLGEQRLISQFFDMFRMATLCTKHPGFAEEREWRIIYSPSLLESTRIKPDIQSVGGIPQKIYKIPLKNVPEEQLLGIELHELIDSIIVGPTQFPTEIKEALVSLLESRKVIDASMKVVISDIPLRH
ncbi:DUF2971 domain-containing protein [Rhizobium sp. BR 317]|uniref:DUF2971 domain-containing protein n=1 Tax=Rhizobium sp. BR 317 TaxID=3040015 RepID=UPI0039BF8A90